MSDVIVYSYGAAEFTSYIFNAVAATVNDKSFDAILKATFIIAGLMAAVQFSPSRDWKILVSSIARYTLITSLLLVPKYTVTIHDDVAQKNYGVANVPLGLALPASYVTTAFHALTSMMETTFHWPDEVAYTKTGFLFASQLIQNTSNIQILDPNFKKSLNSFIAQCVFYDIYLGAYTLKDLLNTDDIWGMVTKKASANRAFMLGDKVTVCREGVPILNNQWAEMLNTTVDKYIKIILPSYSTTSDTQNNQQLRLAFLNKLTTGYNYLTGLSKDETSILMQNLMTNTLQNAAINNPELGVQSYAITKANAQKRSGNMTIGHMMSRWLPAMTGVLECMLYALFPLIIMFALFTNGQKVIGNYIMTMVWLGSWPIIYSVLNFGFTWIIRVKSYGYSLSAYDVNYLGDLQYDMSSLFGYFMVAVPFLSAGLIKLGKQGLDSTFGHMAQLVGGSTQSLAMSSSGEAVTGNLSLGNTSFDNHSMHNMNGFKYDTNANYASGASSSLLPSGSVVTTTLDGGSVVKMTGALSETNTSIGLSEQLTSAASLQTDRVLSATKNDQEAYVTSESTMGRNLYDIGHHINTGTTTGESFSMNTSGGYAQAAAEYSAAIDKFAHENNLSKQDAGRLLRGAYANASAHVNVDSDKQFLGKLAALTLGVSGGASVSAGAKMEGDHSWTTQDAENYSKAQEFLKQNNLNNTFEKAIKGIEENSYRSDTRDGLNLTDSMSASYDNTIQASKNYSTHMQEANSYRELASYAKNNAANINYNANQDFIEFIASKPLYTGQGAMGINQAEALLRTNPELRTAYTNEFVQQKTQESMDNWRAQHITPNSVASAHAGFTKDIGSHKTNIKSDYNLNKHNIDQSNVANNLNNIKIDDAVKKQTQSTIANAGKQIDAKTDLINRSGGVTADAANANVKNNVDTQSYASKAYDLINNNKIKETTD